jgi:Ribbon-helix-helix protein, copG family
MQTISLKLPDTLLAELEREAKARQVTKSVLVRESLEAALRRRHGRRATSCFDLSQDLAGSVKGLPRDLARNSKYMEGFGE